MLVARGTLAALRPMRRCLILILCLLLPLKALAAVVVPITGLPGVAAEASVQAKGGGVPCAFHEQMTADDADRGAPDHPCPHLAMASLPSAMTLELPPVVPPAAPAAVPSRFASVVHAVPLPPPLI
jgi:hypothetical protein